MRALISSFRYPAAAIAILVCVIAANAYTVVLRGGKHVQIPDTFTLTPTSLVYEVAPGMNVSLQVTAIDILATERANGEPSGSFIKRMHRVGNGQPAPTSPPVKTAAAVRTVTNRDLEPYSQARLESERAYEEKAKKMGLPSLEELRRRAQKEAEDLDREFAERRLRMAEADSYWRQRADELESEIEATNARVNSISSSSAAPDGYWPAGGYVIGTTGLDWWPSRFGFDSRFGFNPHFGFGFHRGFFPHRRIFVAPHGATFFPGRFGPSGPGGVMMRPGGRH